MPLYSVRCNLQMDTEHLHRGNIYASMVHHFRWPNDESAIADYPNIEEEFTQSTIGKRWTCARGVFAHELILYRRNLENEHEWHRLDSMLFHLPEFADIDSTFIPGSDAGGHLREAPIYRHTRGAVLVTEQGVDTSVFKRTYVGPVSAVAVQGAAEAEGVGQIITTWFLNPNTSDSPAGPDDCVDIWRPTVAVPAVEHIQNMASDFDHGGVQVLISWRRHIVTQVLRRRASLTRAELRTRSLRGGFTEWQDGSGEPWGDDDGGGSW